MWNRFSSFTTFCNTSHFHGQNVAKFFGKITSRTGAKRALLHAWSNTALLAADADCYILVWAEEPTAHKQETTHNSFWIPINILCFYCLWDRACAWVRTRWGVDKKLSQPGTPLTGNSGESLKTCMFPRQKPASIPTSYSRKLYCSTCTMSPHLWGNMQVLKLGINLLNQFLWHWVLAQLGTDLGAALVVEKLNWDQNQFETVWKGFKSI